MEEEWKETQQGSGVSWTAFVGLMKCQAAVRGKLERRRLAEKRARKARFKSIGDAVVLGSMMMASTRQKREELEELKARCAWPEARDHGPGCSDRVLARDRVEATKAAEAATAAKQVRLNSI